MSFQADLSDGSAWCWGSNDCGQLGDGTTTDSNTPVKVVTPGGSSGIWTEISSGSGNACGLQSDGSAWCWGFNEAGELGDGKFNNSNTPVKVVTTGWSSGIWTQISSGSGNACGLQSDGSAWCWGDNRSGQLGDGTTTDSNTPVEVVTTGGSTGNWTQISAGSDNACGLQSDGSAWCWGYNSGGELGDGTNTNSTIPVKVVTTGGSTAIWTQISSGEGQSCGLQSDGSAWCWGWNADGGLGDGTTTNSNTPVEVVTTGWSSGIWTQISSGSGNACGLQSDGSAWCWGWNADGELGDGSFVSRLTPTRVLSSGKWGPPGAALSSSNVPSSSSTNIGVIVGAVVGGLVAVAGIGVLVVWALQRKRKAAHTPYGGSIDVNKSKGAVQGQQGGIPGDVESPAYEKVSPQYNYNPVTRPYDSLVLSTMSSMAASGDPVLQWASMQQPVSQRDRVAVPAHVRSLEFQWVDVRVIKPLGSGSFGKVFLAELQHTPVAVKLLVDAKAVATASSSARRSGIDASSVLSGVSTASVASMGKEVAVMADIRHPNVAMLVGFCMQPPCVATEYCSRGSLLDVLQSGLTDAAAAAELTWRRRLGMAADAASGMLHLHTRSPAVVHRDLKSPNLLVCADWTVKVSDFGLSKLVSEATRNSSATAGGATNPRWLAPEVLDGSAHSKASDVYSFGVVMWELLTWRLPWNDVENVWTIVGKVLRGGRLEVPSMSQLPGFQGNVPEASVEAYVGLMTACWTQDSSARPDFNAVAAGLRAMLAGLPG